MITPFGATVPPLRSGAKIGSFYNHFQAFCSYLFHFSANWLYPWGIVFVKQDPAGDFLGSGGARWRQRVCSKAKKGRSA